MLTQNNGAPPALHTPAACPPLRCPLGHRSPAHVQGSAGSAEHLGPRRVVPPAPRAGGVQDPTLGSIAPPRTTTDRADRPHRPTFRHGSVPPVLRALDPAASDMPVEGRLAAAWTGGPSRRVTDATHTQHHAAGRAVVVAALTMRASVTAPWTSLKRKSSTGLDGVSNLARPVRVSRAPW